MAEFSDLIGRVKDLDPKSAEFAEILDVTAGKVADLRRAEGRVTPGIFFPMLKLVGIHPAVEVLVTDLDGGLYLKRRSIAENATEAERQSWGNKLHIPGAIFNLANSLPKNLRSLIDREVVGLEDPEHTGLVDRAYSDARTFGTYTSYLPERHIVGFTLLMRIPFSDTGILRGGFEIVGDHNMDQVIDQHRPVVERVRNSRFWEDPEPIIFDTQDIS